MNPFIETNTPEAAEILKEACEAYFVACKKMVKALDGLKAFDAEDDKDSEARASLLKEATERVHFVLIQRESMRMTWSDDFFSEYEIPEEIQKGLGKRADIGS